MLFDVTYRQLASRWLQAAFFLAALIIICVKEFDRRLAYWAAQFPFLHDRLNDGPVHLPVLTVFSAVAFLLGVAYLAIGKHMPKIVEASMLTGVALGLSVCFVEFALKPVFGRLGPADFLATGDYAFHWFHGQLAMGAFPSGHSDQAGAVAAVFWLYYPRARWLYVLGFIGVAIALILGGWHYLSDILAGGFIGASGGILTTLAWHRLAPRWAASR